MYTVYKIVIIKENKYKDGLGLSVKGVYSEIPNTQKTLFPRFPSIYTPTRWLTEIGWNVHGCQSDARASLFTNTS